MTVHTVPAVAIRALLDIAAKADIRTYLNAVHFDGEGGIAEASDGHAALRIKLPISGASFIVPRAPLEDALRAAKRDGQITVGADHVVVGERRWGFEPEARPILGFDRLLGARYVSEVTQSVDPLLHARIASALDRLRTRKDRVRTFALQAEHDEAQAWLITAWNDALRWPAYGLLMPVRGQLPKTPTQVPFRARP